MDSRHAILFDNRLCFFDTDDENDEAAASFEMPMSEGTILSVASGSTKLTLRSGWQEVELTSVASGAEEDRTMHAWREEIESAIARHARVATKLYHDEDNVASSGGGESLSAAEGHADIVFIASPILSATTGASVRDGEEGDELDRLIAATAANQSSDETDEDDGMVYGFIELPAHLPTKHGAEKLNEGNVYF